MNSFIAHIGGVFLYSETPEKLAEWYKTSFGLEWEYAEAYKAYFISYKYNTISSGETRYTAFSILKTDNKPRFQGKAFTLNLRIQNLEDLYKHLAHLDIECSEPKDYPGEGVFAWLQDPEGNYIELWEDTVNHTD